MKEALIKAKAIQALKDCLKEIPFIEAKRVRQSQRQGDVEADFLVDLRLKDGASLQIVAEVKASGQPRLAREAANQLLRCRSVYPDAYGIFVAPYISPQAAEVCAKENFGYVDLAGNCRLSFQKVFIRKDGFRNPFAEKRDLRSLFAPKASRILRVLFAGKGVRWKIQPLADEAGVSLGQVANVKKLLRDREWIMEDDGGFRLIKPEALLAEWAANYTYRKNVVRDFYSMKETDAIEAALAQSCQKLGVQYALTGFSGARRIAPAVRAQRVMAYVSTITEELLDCAGLKEVASGMNASLMLPYDEGVYYAAREMDSLRIVCPVQIYLDLKGYKGRGEEAAEAVWKQVLSKLW